jgi:hypothetical protein
VRHLTLTIETEPREDTEASGLARCDVLQAGPTTKAGAGNTQTRVVTLAPGLNDERRNRSLLHLHGDQPRLGR